MTNDNLIRARAELDEAVENLQWVKPRSQAVMIMKVKYRKYLAALAEAEGGDRCSCCDTQDIIGNSGGCWKHFPSQAAEGREAWGDWCECGHARDDHAVEVGCVNCPCTAYRPASRVQSGKDRGQRALELWRKVEEVWIEAGDGETYCSICGNNKMYGHDPDCPWLLSRKLLEDTHDTG